MRFILRGRRSIWWGWRVMPVAPRIVSDVSYVMRINHEIHFAWQAQYLVRLEVDACCSAHCKWPSNLCSHVSRRHTTTKLRCCKGPSACTLRKLSSKHIRWRLQSRKHVSETEGGCFFSIGPSVLIGLCSLYRVETSAPGLSGHYWYRNYMKLTYRSVIINQ